MIDPNGTKPIYIQIAEWLENEIITGEFQADEKVYSQYQLADMFNINPATAAKGLNVLVDEAILYKKRGLGMFVGEDAKSQIFNKRKEKTLQVMVRELVLEAGRLQVSEQELIRMVKEMIKEKGSGLE